MNIDQLKNMSSAQVVELAKTLNPEDRFYLMKTFKYLAKIEKIKSKLDAKGVKYTHLI
jgi:hypothetical protein